MTPRDAAEYDSHPTPVACHRARSGSTTDRDDGGLRFTPPSAKSNRPVAPTRPGGLEAVLRHLTDHGHEEAFDVGYRGVALRIRPHLNLRSVGCPPRATGTTLRHPSLAPMGAHSVSGGPNDNLFQPSQSLFKGKSCGKPTGSARFGPRSRHVRQRTPDGRRRLIVARPKVVSKPSSHALEPGCPDSSGRRSLGSTAESLVLG
jgi:hypothetical protein